jgi:hypothetical protein
VYFYELHEGDNDLFHDLLLVHDSEIDPEDFFDMVQAIRRRVQDDFEQDSLIEAIGDELERDHGFEVIRDDRLTAAINVSRVDDDNFLSDLGEEEALDEDVDFRGVYASYEPKDDR